MAAGHKTGGRQAGTPNRITTAFKEAVQIAYDKIGGHAAFAEWARENPTEFYRIAARLIPTEIASTNDNSITVVLNTNPRPAIEGEQVQLLHVEH